MGRSISRRAICRRLQERPGLFEKLVGELRVAPVDVRELDGKASAEGAGVGKLEKLVPVPAPYELLPLRYGIFDHGRGELRGEGYLSSSKRRPQRVGGASQGLQKKTSGKTRCPPFSTFCLRLSPAALVDDAGSEHPSLCTLARFCRPWPSITA
jgi:hypothetical protein